MSLPTAAELRKARTDLCNGCNNAHYIGNVKAPVMNSHTWIRTGNTDILVTTDAATEYTAAQELHVADPAKNPAPPVPEFALFSVVVRLSQKNFFFTPCGEWTGPTRYIKELSSVKLTALGECPELGAFSQDWEMVQKSWNGLIDARRTGGVTQVKGIYDEAKGEPRRLKFRHVLFEEKGEGDDDELPAEYTLAEWPHTKGSNDCEAALKAMRAEGKLAVRALPAYDKDDVLVRPARYANDLRGAMVIVYFTVSHWTIGKSQWGEPCDTFTADVVNINILAPPLPQTTPRTPVKRALVNPFASPSPEGKKSKTK